MDFIIWFVFTTLFSIGVICDVIFHAIVHLQDNLAVMKICFSFFLVGENVPTMDWSAVSPYMNPIKNVLSDMKRQLKNPQFPS